MRAEIQYLYDLIDSAEQIMVLVDGFDLPAFESDRRTRSAVLHELTVVGESVSKLSDDLKSRYSDIPWTQIVGTRNVIVHGYVDLLWDRIWRTCTVDEPILKRRAAEILALEFPETAS